MIQDPWHHHLGIDRSTLTLIESLRSILELWSWRCRMQGQETPEESEATSILAPISSSS
jgi:hypothetical protein